MREIEIMINEKPELTEERISEIEDRCESVSDTHHQHVRDEFNYWALDDLLMCLAEIKRLRSPK